MSSSESERVRFSGDLIDESVNIVVGIGHVCKTGLGIRCRFLRQLRALRVRARREGNSGDPVICGALKPGALEPWGAQTAIQS